MSEQNLSFRKRNISWSVETDDCARSITIVTKENVSELLARLVMEEAARIGVIKEQEAIASNMMAPPSRHVAKEEVKGVLVEILEELQHTDESSLALLRKALQYSAQKAEESAARLKKSGKAKIAKAFGNEK